MAAFICHNYLEVSFCNWLMINIHHLIFFSFLSTVVLLVFLTFLLLNRHLEKSLFKSLDWITSSMQNIQWPWTAQTAVFLLTQWQARLWSACITLMKIHKISHWVTIRYNSLIVLVQLVQTLWLVGLAARISRILKSLFWLQFWLQFRGKRTFWNCSFFKSSFGLYETSFLTNIVFVIQICHE